MCEEIEDAEFAELIAEFEAQQSADNPMWAYGL
jgi:hypothetical protein